MESKIIKKSVREFIELILKTGSLDNRFTTNARAIEGVRAHQKLQKSNEELYKNYEKEVFLKINVVMDTVNLNIEGRCDGIIIENDDTIVEEIKSTYKPLSEIEEDFNLLHWAQGKVYGYMLCNERNLKELYVQLSYYNLDSNEVKSFRKKFAYKELEEFFMELVNEYDKYGKLEYSHKEKRNDSISKVQFPFEKYRVGQLELARAWYSSIREESKIFAQAPTGIGKTISTIFPTIKAIGEGYGERLFYLTAKNMNRKVAEDTLDKLREKGLIFRTVSLIAKEKICLNEKVSCNPEDCQYAKDYYDKINDVIFTILDNEQSISRETLEFYGEKNKICPFELSLDLVNWSDGVICDYNYIFDPRVYLRRVLDEESRDNIILVDEAHNLVDRGRDMYTSKLFKSKFLQLRRETRGKCPNLYKYINKINDFFIQEKRLCQEGDKNYFYSKEEPKDIYKILRAFMKEADEVLSKNHKLSFGDMLLDIYFDVNKFISMAELYSDEYMTYVEIDKDEVTLCLFCVDPSKKLRDTINKCRATILFSATLEPFQYFINVLGGDINDYRIRLSSPFPKENLEVYLYPENTRYLARERTLPNICRKIIEFVTEVKGNYMIFFPSYDYMNKAYDYFKEKFEVENLMKQNSDMSNEGKEEFLEKFTKGKEILALCVMGGNFSEGIDLPGDKLIGAVIVGVGYPKVGLEREIIRNYYEKNGERFSYIYPGMNKVMQAVGRVIRTEEDKGRVLLIDDRYLNRTYSDILPKEWDIHKI